MGKRYSKKATLEGVWVFVPDIWSNPSAIFSSRKGASEWIRNNRLTGILMKYPLDESVLDWVQRFGGCGHTTGELEEAGRNPSQKAKFISAALIHYHFEDGKLHGTDWEHRF